MQPLYDKFMNKLFDFSYDKFQRHIQCSVGPSRRRFLGSSKCLSKNSYRPYRCLHPLVGRSRRQSLAEIICQRK